MSNSASDADRDFIAAALPAFISEAVEQTEAIETLLLELEEQPDDRALLDSLFRCAHTVKGSAGIFGLNKVVEFTHHVETLLDQMREGVIALGPQLSTLLLQCNDQIKFLVATATDDDADTPAQKEPRKRRTSRRPRRRQHRRTTAPTRTPPAGTSRPDLGPRFFATAWTRFPSPVTWPAWARCWACTAASRTFPRCPT
jgi:two-component system chemotaxis sensor kinase CheA